jgi:hypothetical protein
VLDAVFPLGNTSLMAAVPPKLVTIFFGANDAVLPGTWVSGDGRDHHGKRLDRGLIVRFRQ